MKKLLSIVLAALLLISSCVLTASAASCDCDLTPVVYVKGYRHLMMKNDDGSMTALLEDDMGGLGDLVTELMPLLAKAIATDDWDEYCDAAYEGLKPLYADAQPRPDGTVKENTGICDNFEDTEFWSWDENSINGNAHRNTYHEYTYVFDFRRSMLENAADLNDFIEAVERKTGHDKVILAGRCGGTNLIAAYVYKYQEPVNYEDIEKLILISSNINGADFMEALLSGNVELQPDAVYRYLKYHRNIEEMVPDEALASFLTITIDMLKGTGLGLKAACDLAQKIYEKTKDGFFARLLKEYYGITPAFTSFVCERYEEYKDYIFQEEGDLEKYAPIIADADEYHYEAQLKFEERLLRMDELGIKTYNVVFYGDQTYPLTKSSLLTSDEVASVEDQSFGAAASELTGSFSDSYVEKLVSQGKGKYISPDKQIDASTCLLPETTWFVKNIHHDFSNGLPGFVQLIKRTDGMDINTYEEYPQFLNDRQDIRAFVPLEETNENDTDWSLYEEDAKEGPLNFIRRVMEYFTGIILKIVESIRGIVSHAQA